MPATSAPRIYSLSDVVWQPPAGISGVYGPPDVILRGTVGGRRGLLRAHVANLRHSTDIFSNIPPLAADAAIDGINTLDSLRIIKLPGTSEVLMLIIPYCYNMEGPNFADVGNNDLRDAYVAAAKLGARRASENILNEYLLRLRNDSQDPGEDDIWGLELYALAVQHNDENAARKFAPYAVHSYDLDKPFEFLEILGPARLQGIHMRKCWLKNALLAMLAEAATLAYDETWTCCGEHDHACLFRDWTIFISFQVDKLSKEGQFIGPDFEAYHMVEDSNLSEIQEACESRRSTAEAAGQRAPRCCEVVDEAFAHLVAEWGRLRERSLRECPSSGF